MEVLAGVLLLLLGAAQCVAAASGAVVETLYNSSGTIQAPEDPGGAFWYEPNARHLWILDMQDSDTNIEVSVDKVDLGLPYTDLHGNSMVNYTEGDFILVGAGPDIMAGEEAMFFGKRQAPQRVVVRSGVGHIFFYSTESVTNATGFTITYNTTGKVTTAAPPTTTIPSPTYDSTFVSINGILVSNWSVYNDSFREAISKMASDYQHSDLNMTTVNVDPSDVLINDAKSCHPDFCPDDRCVAYNFSLATLVDGETAFSKREIENMLADSAANKYIAEVYGPECQICDENPEISLVSYIVIPIVVVVFGVAFTVAAWTMTSRSTVNDAQEKYQQEQKDRIDDQRRRSSGDVSILGVGGRSLASQGSRSSRRYTMPFPKPRSEDGPEVDDEGQEEEVDTSGFIYYDPDLAITNPAQFGLEGVVTEFQRQSPGSHAYTNKAFVTDDESSVALQQRPAATSYADDTDSTDSDNGGAVSFRPQRRELTLKFEVSADIHSPDGEGETNL